MGSGFTTCFLAISKPSIRRLTPQAHALYCPTNCLPGSGHGAGAGLHPASYSGYIRKYGSPACETCCPATYCVTSSWRKSILAMPAETGPLLGASAIPITAGHPDAGGVPDGRLMCEVSVSDCPLLFLRTCTSSTLEPGV